jgi:CubicO group peptidase (beta-lactamase class C family)
MSCWISLRAIGCSVALLLAIGSGQTQAQVPCDFAPVDTRFGQLLTEAGLFGGALLIGSHEGLLHERYFGLYQPGTVVPIASATKLLSAVRVVQLASQGRLDLDSPIAETLPQFQGVKGTMTVRQMFSHTAGYGDDLLDPVLGVEQPSLAAAVEQIACCVEMPTGWSPGAQFAYGGISMQVAGRVAEVVSGGDWQAGWQQSIAAPLGISSIDWQGLGQTSNYRIAGGARSNLRDYGRLLHMLANDGFGNGRRVLGAGALPLLSSDNVGDLPVGYAPPMAFFPVRYALGSWIEPTSFSTQLPTLSSLGAFGFFPWLDRSRGLYGVFMIRGGANVNELARPAYEAMMASAQHIVDQQACEVLEWPLMIRIDSFESGQW